MNIAPKIRQKVENEIMIYYAGGIAEKRFKGKHPSNWHKTYDIDVLVDLVLHMTCSEEETAAYLQWLYIRAKNIIYIQPKYGSLSKP
jgi:hypothetical protein